MSFIYLIHSDALWYIYVLLRALLKTWDLDARGHLSVKGKSFCEGAVALCWAGLKLYRLTALKPRWPFLLCITCTWIPNQCKQRGKKTPPHSGADPGRVQNLSSKQENKQDPVQEPALLQPGVSRGGRRSSRGGGDGLWARFKTGRCWWEPTKRRVRASDTDLRDFVRVTTGCAGTASLLLKRASPPRTETFHEAKARASGQHPREDFISPTHPPLSQPNFVIQWTKGNFTLTGYFLSFSKAVADW